METAVCNYRGVTERDMDLLFLQAMASDKGFFSLFSSKLGFDNEQVHILNIELSKSDADYGETDITVIVSYGSER